MLNLPIVNTLLQRWYEKQTSGFALVKIDNKKLQSFENQTLQITQTNKLLKNKKFLGG